MQNIDVEWAGQVDYLEAWELQKALVAERIANPETPGKLLLLEHPHTYTLGRNGRLENLLLNEDELTARQIAFYQVDRGGDITYHGPGQLVGYPILSLKRVYEQPGLGMVQRYVTDIEEVIIQTLTKFGIKGQRFEGSPGTRCLSLLEPVPGPLGRGLVAPGRHPSLSTRIRPVLAVQPGAGTGIVAAKHGGRGSTRHRRGPAGKPSGLDSPHRPG